MPLTILTLLRLALEGAVEWLRWQAALAQFSLKTALIDRKEKYEDEAERIQGQINDLRLAGRHDRADELYDSIVRRTQLTVDLSTIVLDAEKGDNSSNPEGPIHPTT